jgi:hypothetical protein
MTGFPCRKKEKKKTVWGHEINRPRARQAACPYCSRLASRLLTCVVASIIWYHLALTHMHDCAMHVHVSTIQYVICISKCKGYLGHTNPVKLVSCDDSYVFGWRASKPWTVSPMNPVLETFGIRARRGGSSVLRPCSMCRLCPLPAIDIILANAQRRNRY